MLSSLLPDGGVIDRWADDVSAPALVPLLVRKLISQTTDPTWVDVPAGAATRFPGWDGEVEVQSGNTWVPTGRSLWEIGTDSRITGKANSDYTKRTNETPEPDRKKATYVFVTPRLWAHRKAWLKAKQKRGDWADVRAIDAEGLASWAEMVPYVHIWLSHEIDGRATGAVPLDLWWDRWSQRSYPHPIEPAFILRGRTDEAAKILGWAVGSPRRLVLDAEPPEDGIAFVGAVLKQATDELGTDLMRAVVVDSDPVWGELLHHRKPMIMITPSEDVNVRRAVDKGHHVLVVASPNDPGARGDLLLTDLAREDLIAGLETLGLDPLDAIAFVDDADGDLKTIRRRLSRIHEFQYPSWSVDDRVLDLLAAVLAGSWDAASTGDREALALLAGRPYEEAEPALLRLTELEDAPVSQRGTIWFLANRRDAWRLTAARMERGVLDRFSGVVESVLGARDPGLDLPAEERWMANVRDKGRPHSERIRQGLANTIAMLAGWRHLERMGEGSGPTVARDAVRPLLERINDDPSGGGWISLGDVLPSLAEAAPEEFLAAVEAGLGTEPSPLVALLDTDSFGGLFSRSYQAPVLWGLENLAWSPMYLPRVTRALARWASKDPGGKWSNRPSATFRLIFLPWFPQTAANVDERIAILETVAAEDDAWPLLKSLLRQPLDHSGMSHRPAWRTWAPPGDRVVPTAERGAVESAVVRLLVGRVGSTARRWLDLLDSFPNLELADRAAIAAALQLLDPAQLGDDDRQLIWRKLEEEIARHRAFRGSAAWAMSDEELAPLLAVVGRFVPADVVSQVVWLFEAHPEIELVTGGTDYKQYEALLPAKRTEAINRVLAVGWDAVDRLVVKCGSPFAVGFTLGSDVNDETRPLAWGTGAASMVEAMCGFMAGRSNLAGWGWAEATTVAWLSEWGPQVTARAIQSASRRRDGWELAARLGPDVEAAYWGSFQGFWRGADAWIAIAKLLHFGHPFAAIDLVSAQLHDDEEFDPTLAHRVLLEAAGVEPRGSHDASMLQHYLPKILDRLEAAGIPESDIARLEWVYLIVLEHSERPATRLGRLLADDPAFFVEVLSLVYRAEGEAPRDLGSDQLRMADQARRLLAMWKTPPGSTENEINGGALFAWVTEARRLAADAGRVTIADFKIGQVLWWAPPAADGHHPAVPVRDLIETASSATIEQGFANEALNSRGVVMRGRGGDQERALAADYQGTADALRAEWPRTAAIFDGLAANYVEQATRWDIEAEVEAHDAAEHR